MNVAASKTNAILDESRSILVAGKASEASDCSTIDVVAPGDGQVFARIASGGAVEVDAAVRAARAAFNGSWGKLTATERGRLLVRWSLAVEGDAEELARLESRDTGKPLRQARADVVGLARYLEYYGTAADKLHGDTIPFLNTHLVAIMRVPFGVTAHIVPWNYPIQIFGRSVGASLAAGNACVVKPAEDASLSILRVARLAEQAGIPAGALNIVTGYGRSAGAALAGHPDVDFVSFTGSPATGTAIQTAAAQHHARVTLELGGKSAQVIFADADIDALAPVAVNAVIQNCGQTCSAGSRLLIQRDIFDKVVEAVADRFRVLRAGRPEDDLDVGPLISALQHKRVNDYLDPATSGRFDIVAEGSIDPGAPSGGHYIKPTLIAPVAADHRLAQEEVFGPILVATPFDDEQDAIAKANGTPFGLVAGVWSSDAKRAVRVARRMRAGQVFVNGYGAGGGIELPFGGFGRSGHGREKGFEGLVEFTTTQTLVISHG